MGPKFFLKFFDTMLLSAQVERVSVSRMLDIFCLIWFTLPLYHKPEIGSRDSSDTSKYVIKLPTHQGSPGAAHTSLVEDHYFYSDHNQQPARGRIMYSIYLF